jgi:riboflavin synthase
MFTGIIEEVGIIQTIQSLGNRAFLTITARTVLDDLKVDDSIAVNGACLTVTAVSSNSFSADVSPETLRVTNLGTLQSGSRVNLERALRVSDRLHGHLVQGHVDSIAQILEMRRDGDTLILTISVPESIHQYLVVKGSIAVDGISLTINTCDHKRFTCTIIPHTVEQTTLGLRKVGDIVNLEIDIIGKYVEKLMMHGHQDRSVKKQVIDMEMLKEYGWR